MKASRLAVIGLTLGACTVEDVALVGRQCPCPSELSCVDGICVEGSGGNAGGAGCTPKITIADFHVQWQTPSTIRWAWDVSGAIDDFSAYELVTAENTSDLSSRSGSAVIWTVSENPELGELIVPDSNSPTEDEVESTISDGHAPKTTYFGQLFAIDNAGCAFTTSSVQTVTTDAPSGEIELFGDGPVQSSFPASYGLSSEGAFAGSACLEYVHPGCTQAACYENLKLFELGISTADLLSENQFLTKAYVELSVSISGPGHSYWSQFWLMLADGTDVWRLEPFVLRAGGSYRTYQIPLRVLAKDGVLLDLSTFTDSGISGFNVGGLFTPDAVVRVDEVSVKW